MLRPLIQKPCLLHILKGNEDEERILELEYQYYFDNVEDPIYKVQILNNLPVDTGFIYNGKIKCEFCGLEHSDNCDFTFSDRNITLRDIIRNCQTARPKFSIVVLWRNPCPEALLLRV